MNLKRTNFNGIVAEFLPPKKPSNNIAIVCDGLPSLPGRKSDLVKWFSCLGFWTFHIRYKGAWESTGRFLDHDPSEDIFEVIDALPRGFKSLWDGEEFRVEPDKVVVIGASFGGCAALLASLDQRVDKVIALAPVIDWTKQGSTEPLDWLEHIILDGYPGAFRFDHQDWLRLSRGEFFQPLSCLDQFDANKIFVIHAQDDTVVSIGPTRDFVSSVGCKYVYLKKGDHLSSGRILRWPLSRSVRKFLFS